MVDQSILDATRAFEAVKVSMRQDKEGQILVIRIHPDDVPRALHTDWVGSRYMVGMTKLAEDGQPEPMPESVEGNKMVARAGMLCREFLFAEFIYGKIAPWETVKNGDLDEQGVRDMLCYLLRVGSRAELKTNELAQSKFQILMDDYNQYKFYNPL
jgi:hypothetical protein